jgi:hypothetical protein
VRLHAAREPDMRLAGTTIGFTQGEEKTQL